MELLKSLDDVPWDSVTHAYGAADDVPELLRTLASGADLEHVAHALWGNVFHQGSRCEASPLVVPFLYEILREGPPSPELRSFLLSYLHGLALGYPGDVFPARPRPDAWEAQLAGFDDRAAQALPATRPASREALEVREAQLEAHWGTKSYMAVEAGLEDVLEHCASPHTGNAVDALALVASFPRRRQASAPSLRVAAADARPAVRGAGMLALALLGEAPVGARAEVARKPADDDARWARLHAAAALALGPDPDAIDAPVVETLSAPLGELGRRETPFANVGSTLASGALLALPHRFRSQVVDALARQHHQADGWTCVQLSRDLLTLVFPDPPPPSASGLDEPQRRALEAVYASRGWEWGNYALLLADFALPNTRAGLRGWLDG